VVTIAEMVKLSVSLCWVLAFDRDKLTTPSMAWAWQSVDLSFVAGLFALQNQLNMVVIAKLGAGLFMILGNLKIVFTCIFMRLLLGKRFANLQWVAVVLLTVSAAVVKAPLLTSAGRSEHPQMFSGCLLLLVATVSSGIASVKNEMIVKNLSLNDKEPQMPFMMQNLVLYIWGTAINYASWLVWGQQASLIDGFSFATWVSLACLVTFGLACAIMLKYLDNVVRCFSAVGQVLATIIMSRFFSTHLHEGKLDYFYVASMTLLAAALILYQAHDSKHLPVLFLAAICAALIASTVCMKLDA